MTPRLVRLAVPLYTAAVIVVLSLADGGFFRWTWPWATAGLAAAAAGAALLRTGARFTRLEVAFVAGLAALSAWQALSAEWSPDPERSLEDALRGTVYVAAAAAFLVLGRVAGARAIVAGVVGGAGVTLALGLVEHARRGTSDPFQGFQGDLLYQPIGYANAVAIVAVIAVLLALGLLLERPATPVRAALAAVVLVSAAALLLTEGRGAWLAGAVGLAAAAVFYRLRRWPLAFPGFLGLVGLLVVIILVSPVVVEPARLHGILSDRAYYWPVVWHALGSPLHGLGSGAFAQLWALERPVPVNAIDAHSLFLEALLELGAVGLVVVAVTLALPLVVASRLTGGWAAGATGAYTAFLVHAAFDWDWEMPAVTIAGLACGATLLAADSAARPRRLTRTMADEGVVMPQVRRSGARP